MINTHFYHLLNQWYQQRDQFQWVLGTIYKTEGSAYRKTGSLMFFNDLGQQLGLLSGGCLEADLMQHSKRVMQTKKAVSLCYNSRDEDDISFQLGLGCGGIVWILLQPINKNDCYFELEKLQKTMCQRRGVAYQQTITFNNQKLESVESTAYSTNNIISDKNISKEQQENFISHNKKNIFQTAAYVTEHQNKIELLSFFSPPPHLMIIGGGIDAIPVASIAAQLGWEVSLADPRPANARHEHFQSVTRIEKSAIPTLSTKEWFSSVNAAIVMAHNTKIDADALRILTESSIQYCALLGPEHRKQQVLEIAGIHQRDLPCHLFGPAGFAIGAELPESIALSILSQCHSVLFKKKTSSKNTDTSPQHFSQL